eukprot:TRINITY_DN77564_c0_g1_i1.p1 TRINITY_DN77564_c0_g1~~TRINITY_DN77564_c0_g1_i1.p1  ORF type:complete len:145 (+),score=33.47 TRINITY_DN77564_c0_g1_i1:137-571(+)
MSGTTVAADPATEQPMKRARSENGEGSSNTVGDGSLALAAYHREAMSTAVYPQKGNNVAYVALGLVGESGEVANKVKKVLRDEGGEFTTARRLEIADEVGDVLWYAAAMADELGVPLEEIAKRNLAKLRSRRERGAIAGSGDQR